MSDKQIKQVFKGRAKKNPEKHYPVDALKSLGFFRNQCTSCKQYFWDQDKKKNICGDSACSGGFRFIGNTPAKKKLDYIEAWKEFSRIHKKLGYTEVKRYPTIARWNPTTDFTIASIAAFQPYVVTGEVKPPANPLVIPQFCLRFNDIDNVGITGAHYAGFIMMGQHAFVSPKDYDINKYLSDHLYWINKGMGVSNGDITISEDAWAGGGNLGPSVEFFSAGLEISNQVYMQYETTSNGYKDLGIKVLDMGQGHERVPWFTQGDATSYETTFPTVVKKLRKDIGLAVDKNLMKKFLPYAAWLNIDEVDNIDKTWKKVATAVGINVKDLKKEVQEQAALYSIAEHSRALLFALSDGGLPSNVGGGYNLRVIFRRALGLADHFGWDVYLPKLCELHAQYLKPLFPELKKNLADVKKILDVEKNKYETTRQKAHGIIATIVKKKITDKTLLQLYDSKGISPELVREEALKEGVKINVPENFYARVSELHEKKEQVHETKRKSSLNLGGIKETDALYFGDWKLHGEFKSTVAKIVGKQVVLDQTWFYPTSGGQINDVGYLNESEVVDVFKQGPYIVHVLKKKPDFSEGDTVTGKIDMDRRKQLAQHHTATHIINAAARIVLGNHINQAGARKTLEKGTLDITHYARLTDEELHKIELEANKIVQKKVALKKSFYPRGDAEKKFGVNIYQGGVAPGHKLRIVEIPGIDVQACGGTHLNNTSEAGIIRIVSSQKIADDIVRLEYVAGDASTLFEDTLGRRDEQIVSFVKKEFLLSLKISSDDLRDASHTLSVSSEKLFDTFKKFVSLVKENDTKLKLLKKKHVVRKFHAENLKELSKQIFSHWKEQNKEIKQLHDKLAKEQIKNIKEKSVVQIDLDTAALREIALQKKCVLLINNEGTFVYRGSDEKFNELRDLGAKGGGKEVKQGKLPDPKKVIREFAF